MDLVSLVVYMNCSILDKLNSDFNSPLILYIAKSNVIHMSEVKLNFNWIDFNRVGVFTTNDQIPVYHQSFSYGNWDFDDDSSASSPTDYTRIPRNSKTTGQAVQLSWMNPSTVSRIHQRVNFRDCRTRSAGAPYMDFPVYISWGKVTADLNVAVM